MHDLKCPHCGAKVGARWRTCWLCGLELPTTPAGAGPAQALAEPAAPQSASRPGTISLITQGVGFLLAGTIVLIMIGLVANGDYGGVIALVILLVPAGLVTLAKSFSRRSQGTEMPIMEKLGTFLLSLAVTVGAVAALGVAAFVALLIACFAILSSGNSGNMFR
jgi:hypothetical protein